MSLYRPHPHNLLVLALLHVSALALFASSSQADPSRLGMPWPIERIRSGAIEGDIVTLEGRVVSISRSRFFTLEDASGDRIVTAIPNHLMRDTGKPKSGETIRVQGRYDHKTLLDVDKSKNADTQKNWGIRVSAMDRNVSTTGRNPNAPKYAEPSADQDTKAAPAAPMSTAITVGTPNAPAGLKSRLAAARKRALAAQKRLEDANAEVARGEYRKVEGDERNALSEKQKHAQHEYEKAVSVIPPLVDEAIEAGVDRKALELFEAGLTKDGR
jgi:hypothetical protein